MDTEPHIKKISLNPKTPAHIILTFIGGFDNIPQVITTVTEYINKMPSDEIYEILRLNPKETTTSLIGEEANKLFSVIEDSLVLAKNSSSGSIMLEIKHGSRAEIKKALNELHQWCYWSENPTQIRNIYYDDMLNDYADQVKILEGCLFVDSPYPKESEQKLIEQINKNIKHNRERIARSYD